MAWTTHRIVWQSPDADPYNQNSIEWKNNSVYSYVDSTEIYQVHDTSVPSEKQFYENLH